MRILLKKFKKSYCESNMKAIKKEIKLGKKYQNIEENKKSVAQLIYDFLYFYVYDFDSENMVINIKEPGSESMSFKAKNGQLIKTGAGFS